MGFVLIYSSSNLPDPSTDYDLCIIGSGPAGMTLALELKYSGLRICVLESGDRSTRERDDLGAVRSTGITIRRDSRVRSIGGSSQTWSGFIAPLDDIDLQQRDDLHPAWPITADEIYQQSDENGFRYKIPARASFATRCDGGQETRLPPVPGIERKTFKTQNPVVRYGDQYSYAFLKTGFDLVMEATVTSLVLARDEASLKTVTAANYTTSSGRSLVLKAARFVLAASAIETIRILKNSGIGNESGRLGLGFMNHPKGYVGRIRFSKPLPKSHELFHMPGDGYDGYVGLRLADDIQRSENLLNCYVRFEPDTAGDFPKAKELTRSIRNLAQAAGTKNATHLLRSTLDTVRSLSGVPQTVQRLVHRLRSSRQSAVTHARVRCFMEMQPTDLSYVTLTEEQDRLGVALPAVVHDITDIDFRSAKRLIEAVAEGFQSAGIGTVSVEPNLRALLRNDASHHLGGAPMGEDPQTSVVDRDLKLHAAENLFLAGGAMFPSSGSANPTMTIVALSMRLAAHLAPPPRQATAPKPQAKHKALIIGAGRRVKEDVVPAFEAVDDVDLVKIYATGRRAIFGPTRYYETAALEELNPQDLSDADIVYIAVPPKQLEAVLIKITGSDCRHVTLMIDTPAITNPRLPALLEKFARMVVAEDSVTLPWLAVLPSRVRSATFHRSGYRYHAVALARAVLHETGGLAELASFSGKRNKVEIQFSNGARALVLGPRDYAKGRLDLELENCTQLTSVLGTSASIEPIVIAARCVGFRCATQEVALSPEESDLLGAFEPADTIVSKMLDLKRLGLKRMIEATLEGRVPYTYRMALEDAQMRWS